MALRFTRRLADRWTGAGDRPSRSNQRILDHPTAARRGHQSRPRRSRCRPDQARSPFDLAYLHLTLLLDALDGTTLVVNSPRGLRDANEKLYACRFPEATPATIVTADAETLLTFAAEHGGRPSSNRSRVTGAEAS